MIDATLYIATVLIAILLGMQIGTILMMIYFLLYRKAVEQGIEKIWEEAQKKKPLFIHPFEVGDRIQIEDKFYKVTSKEGMTPKMQIEFFKHTLEEEIKKEQ